jgi:mannose-6-phosphate isomerase
MIVICMEGNGKLSDNEGNTVTLRQGETVLLPASTKSFTLEPEGGMKALTSYIR